MAFPERVLYQKAIKMFKTIRGNTPKNAIYCCDWHSCKTFTFII